MSITNAAFGSFSDTALDLYKYLEDKATQQNKQLEIKSIAYQDLYDKYIRSNSDLHNLEHDTHKVITTLQARIETATSYSMYQTNEYNNLKVKLDEAVLKLLKFQSYCKIKDQQLTRRRELGATVVKLFQLLNTALKTILNQEVEITQLKENYARNYTSRVS